MQPSILSSEKTSGTIIVLDGLDGVGKATQTTQLLHQLQQHTDRVRLLSYPDYESPSSALVRMYLAGELSSSPGEVNPYAAASFYAVDRYASYLKDWKADYEAGWILLMNRYVSSNAIHQMPKLPKDSWAAFLHWLDDYEHQKLGLPRPNQVLLLEMPHDVADRLLLSRYEGDESKKDIHERDQQYLHSCAAAADYAAHIKGWRIIPCSRSGVPHSVEEIAVAILQQTKEVLPFL